MNIYFTAAIKGGRGRQPEYADIVDALAKHGTVLTPHVANDDISTYGETSFSAREILLRELTSLNQADIVVAEVTTPSLGVGYLISYATALGKDVVALYRAADTLKLSEIISGDTNVRVRTYETADEVEDLLKEELYIKKNVA